MKEKRSLNIIRPESTHYNTYGCTNFPVIKIDIEKNEGDEMEVHALMTVDDKGGTFSITDGNTQYSMPIEAVFMLFSFVGEEWKKIKKEKK